MKPVLILFVMVFGQQVSLLRLKHGSRDPHARLGVDAQESISAGALPAVRLRQQV